MSAFRIPSGVFTRMSKARAQRREGMAYTMIFQPRSRAVLKKP